MGIETSPGAWLNTLKRLLRAGIETSPGRWLEAFVSALRRYVNRRVRIHPPEPPRR